MEKVIHWLIRGDVSIQYQVSRDLLHAKPGILTSLQNRIESEGWGLKFLNKRHRTGHWGITFYQPKWTSTHYTLLDLKTIALPCTNVKAAESTRMVLEQPAGTNGGINYAETLHTSDVCVNGMILNFASYFLPGHTRLTGIVDFLLDVQMADGGWNCQYLVKGTTHSSLHSTLSVLEGLLEFRKSGNLYKIGEITRAEKKAIEFLLIHKLFQSHHTGKIIDQRMLRLSFPCRWRYDILRALDYFRESKTPADHRMQPALDIVKGKRKKDGTWPLQEKHKGQVHFDMEKPGTPSRWNTLRALRVLQYFQP
jgi:hypothetical protein